MVKTTSSSKKTAIVHDWLIGGGAEKVVEAMHQVYPEAPIYTSFVSDEWQQRLNGKVVTGYLQHWPFSKLRKFLPILRALWFNSLRLADYDLVISTSGAEAKGIKVPKSTKHIAYIHAPTHYYWSRYDDYINRPGFGVLDPLARLGLKLLVGPLRSWDYKAAQRPDVLLANSTHTAQQIKKYYKRTSTVVFPPVDAKRFMPTKKIKRHGFVIAGRQTPYKRIDLAVAACTKLNLPLLVIGNGPENSRLRQMAGPTISFITNASDSDVVEAFQSAEGFIFPGVDDFGITPVEAMAAGCPVIAYKAGGALNYVINEKTGLFFDKQTVSALCETLVKFNRFSFSAETLQAQAKKFSPDKFKHQLESVIKKAIK